MTRRALVVLVSLLAACGADGRPALMVPSEPPRPEAATHAEPQTRERVADPSAEALADAGRYVWRDGNEPSHACSDGPDGAGRASIPGGDLGALLVAAATIEPARGLSLSPDELDAMVDSFTARFAHVTLHGEASMLAPDVEAAALACDHVRLLLQHPEEYGVRDGLVRALLDSLARREAAHPGTLRWSSDADEDREVVVLDVERLPSASRVPVFATHEADAMRVWLFVPEAASLHAPFVDWLDAFAPAEDAEQRATSLYALATRQARATLRHLARQAPVYEARFAHGDESAAPVISGPVASMGCRTY